MKPIHQVLSAMLGQEERVSLISNNLANVNTVGFKRESVTFQDHLKILHGETATEGTRSLTMAWPALHTSYTDYSSGALLTTGRALDVAIEGEGFFEVGMDGDAIGYTRAGNFTLDADGRLVTADGRPVHDVAGYEIVIDPYGEPPLIGGDGAVVQGGQRVATIGIVRFDDPGSLERVGHGLWRAPAGLQADQIDPPRLRTGALEGSNVNVIREMVDMIETQRAYEVNQRVMQSFDDIARRRIEAASS